MRILYLYARRVTRQVRTPGESRFSDKTVGIPGQVFRPHHGAPHGGPSPRQLVAGEPSVTRPGAGNPMSWSSSWLSHFGHATAVAVRDETSASKLCWHFRQVYS
jgi:hypothetical protein